MRKIRINSLLFLILILFGCLLLSQKMEEDREVFEKAKESVYKQEWGKSVAEFRKLINSFKKSEYLDESLYYLALSLHNLSKEKKQLEIQTEYKADAIKHLNSLIETCPSSLWVDDAQILRAQISEELVKDGQLEYRKYIDEPLKPIKDSAGEELNDLDELYESIVSAYGKDESEMELKLVALDILMRLDEKKAFYILSKIIKEAENSKLRMRAIFILSQSNKKEAMDFLVDLATNDPDKKIRSYAVSWLGLKQDKKSLDALINIYNTSSDNTLKGKIINPIGWSDSDKAIDKLIDVAENEKDAYLKGKAISWLAFRNEKKCMDTLIKIYDDLVDSRLKKKAIFGIGQHKREEAKTKLIEIAQKDKDMQVRKVALFWLKITFGKSALDILKD